MVNSPKKLSLLTGGYEFSMTPEMMEEVMAEWKRENPGRDALEMSGEVFADRLMEKIYASARKAQ